MAGTPSVNGSVIAFDDPAGTGEVRASDGSVHPFHCTAIADGSRTIEVGASVRFDVAAGRAGTWEAVRIRPV